MGYHQNKRISWGSLILPRINMFRKHKFEKNVLGNTVDTAPLGFFYMVPLQKLQNKYVNL